MRLRFVTLTLCLLSTVILHGAVTQTETSAPPTEAPGPVEPTTESPTEPGNTTTPMVPTTQSNETDPVPTVSENGGLSAGAIAGITVGSIAGVAAVGGGIFGALKYTGKI